MSKKTPPKKNLALYGLLFLVPALYIQTVWILSSRNSIPADHMDNFLAYFPSFIQNGKLLLLFSLVCCVLGVVVAARSFNQRSIGIRLLSIMTVLAGSLILLLDVIQMM